MEIFKKINIKPAAIFVAIFVICLQSAGGMMIDDNRNTDSTRLAEVSRDQRSTIKVSDTNSYAIAPFGRYRTIMMLVRWDGWYIGGVRGGERDGFGKMTLRTTNYIGYWANDRRNGYAVKIHRFSTFRDIDDVMERRLKLSVFEGLWKDGLQHGHGRMTYPNGGVWEGEWYEGERTDNGVWLVIRGADWCD